MICIPSRFESPRFRMSLLARSDASELYAHFSDPDVCEFLDIDPLSHESEAARIVSWAQQSHFAGRGARWAIRWATGGELLGTCGFNSLVYERGRRGEVAYDLGKAHWGQGVMFEVLPELLELGFETLHVNRIEAFVTPGNQRSERLLDRLGFTREGVLRGYGYWRGAYWDQVLFSLLRGDRAPRRPA